MNVFVPGRGVGWAVFLIVLASGWGCVRNNGAAPDSSQSSKTEGQDVVSDGADTQKAAPLERGEQKTVDRERICAIDQPFPYAVGSPYVGLHANRENNNRVYCPGGDTYERDWVDNPVLKGFMVFQPISLSPDGSMLYVAVARTQGCKFYAIRTATGETAWCKGEEGTPEALTMGVSGGTAEVDKDGNVYITDGLTDPKDTAILGWNQEGKLKWRASLADVPGILKPGYLAPAGLHFTPDGYVATATPGGVVVLLDRESGKILTSYDIPKETGFVSPRGKEEHSFTWLPRGLRKKITSVIGELTPEEMKVFSGASKGASGSFSDNTLGITVMNQILIVGGGPTPDDGSLVALDILKEGDQPSLKLRWYMVIKSGSATSPAISQDGTRVVVGDGSQNLVYGHVDKCNDNTDNDPRPEVCDSGWTYPLLGKSLLGSAAMDENGVVFAWNSSKEAGDVDLFAVQDVDGKPEVVWETCFAKEGDPNLQWTSAATVMDNQVVGTVSTIRKALNVDAPLMLDLSHEMVGVDRFTGEILWRLPIPDDSINSPAVGPDGSLYVPLLGILDLMSPSRKVEYAGGVIKYRPVYHE